MCYVYRVNQDLQDCNFFSIDNRFAIVIKEQERNP